VAHLYCSAHPVYPQCCCTRHTRHTPQLPHLLQVEVAVERILTSQAGLATRLSAPRPMLLDEEQWEVLGKRLGRLERVAEALPAAASQGVVGQLAPMAAQVRRCAGAVPGLCVSRAVLGRCLQRGCLLGCCGMLVGVTGGGLVLHVCLASKLHFYSPMPSLILPGWLMGWLMMMMMMMMVNDSSVTLTPCALPPAAAAAAAGNGGAAQ
jgi:hypothetical protein